MILNTKVSSKSNRILLMARKFVYILMHHPVLVRALQQSKNPMLQNSGGTIIHLNKHKIMKQ
jgi:hypothetical protein